MGASFHNNRQAPAANRSASLVGVAGGEISTMPATIEKLRIQCHHHNDRGGQRPPDALENLEN